MTTPKGSGRKPSTPKVPGGRVPSPGDMLAAAQSAVEAAQSAASQALEAAQLTAGQAFDAAVRLPPASAQLAAQLPDLIQNLSIAIDRLNSTIDRLDRTLALADPAFAAYDRLLPRLEAMIGLGEDLFTALAKLPGVSLLGRFTGKTPEPPPTPEPPKRGRRK
jgi:ABC-type transporter Mla subunit MlaD